MKIEKFINNCIDSGYEWHQGEHDGDKGYFVGSKRFNSAAHFSLEAIEGNDWPTLEKQVMQGKNIYHVTRVVGYYSKVENWNKSKHGELKDRHKGDYAVKQSSGKY